MCLAIDELREEAKQEGIEFGRRELIEKMLMNHETMDKIKEYTGYTQEKIDEIAEYNQLKVIKAMQDNRVSAGCFNYASGYGYDDQGRDTLEKVYASIFHTESALVRPQITCGTHALSLRQI